MDATPDNSAPLICVYAIMRNEGPRVAAWLDSTVCYRTGHFVLDTGSTDNTIAELVRLDIPHARASFDPFRFDDARNAALALVPQEFDLVLRLDADEVPDPGWREAFDAVYRPEVGSYRYTVVNETEGAIWGEIRRNDLHKRHGFRWKYPTHEILEGPGPMVDVPGMIVRHTSGPRDRSDNAAILARAVMENPHDHRMAFYFARELWYVGKWVMCRREMTRFLAMPGGWGPERCEAYRILAAIDYFPEPWLWKAIGEAPERREPFVDMARHHLRAGRPFDAQRMLVMAGTRSDRSIYTTDPQAWDDPFDDLVDAVTDAVDEPALPR